MRRFLFEGALILLAALGVMALVFRNSRAWEMLRFARNALWLYVGVVVLLAALEVYRMVN